MNQFQKIILYTAVIVLILTLVIIGVSLSYVKNDQTWPPMTPECPDYWLSDGSGNNTNCINIKDLGTCPPRENKKHLVMNFNTPAFSGQNSLCAKYTWAQNCKLSWDGITYGTKNPCQR